MTELKEDNTVIDAMNDLFQKEVDKKLLLGHSEFFIYGKTGNFKRNFIICIKEYRSEIQEEKSRVKILMMI